MAFVRYPHPVLTVKAVPRAVDAALIATGQRLLEAAVEAGARGLAGAHIGDPAPVIALLTGLTTDPESYQLYFNPRVVELAVEVESDTESSVSSPGVLVKIERPIWVEIAFDDAGGTPRQARFDGFLARCALHEIEQMNGRFFLLNLSRLKREMALKKGAKLHAATRPG
jgi:peptide deformylase